MQTQALKYANYEAYSSIKQRSSIGFYRLIKIYNDFKLRNSYKSYDDYKHITKQLFCVLCLIVYCTLVKNILSVDEWLFSEPTEKNIMKLI